MQKLIFILFFSLLFFGCYGLIPSADVPVNSSSTPASDTHPSKVLAPVDSDSKPPTTNPTTASDCIFPQSTLNYPIPVQKVGNFPLLVIIGDTQDPDNPTPSVSDVERNFFGSSPSVSDYFFNNSGGRMRLINAGVLSYSSDHLWSYYWNYNDPTDSDHDGWTGGEKKFWTQMLLKADSDFDFSRYDTNHDGYVFPDELGIFIVVPYDGVPGGATRVLASREYPDLGPLVLDGVILVTGSSSGSGNPLNFGTPAHELLHQYLGTVDLYFSYFFPYALGAYSIMDQPWNAPDLDAYQKMRAGWLNLKEISSSGCYKIQSVDFSNTVNIIEKKVSGGSEFYILENRQRGTYNQQIPDTGLSIIRAIEAPGRYPSIRKPDLVSDSDWNSIASNDWGRRGLWMFRPSYYPFNDYSALWSDGDLSSPVTFNWSDGSSAFTLNSVSSSSDTMTYSLTLPKR